MTFEELEGLEELGICGGIVEISENKAVRRGTIDFICYRNGCPWQIEWDDVKLWIPDDCIWVPDPEASGHVMFGQGSTDRFGGPYETDTEAIIFMNESLSVTIFPRYRTGEPPYEPCNLRHETVIRRETIKSQEPHKKSQ